jgi:hypothetical protein
VFGSGLFDSLGIWKNQPSWSPIPIVGGAWLAAAILAVLLAPGTARKLGVALATREGITAAAPEGTVARTHELAHRLATAFMEAEPAQKRYLPGSGPLHWTAAVILLLRSLALTHPVPHAVKQIPYRMQCSGGVG